MRGTVLSVPSKTPGQTILDTAREEKAFCIIMGTRGRSAIKKAILGSVSDYLVKNAEIPVIVVRKKKDDLAP
jgi:nucleotide-binding universal stress UspA family protein